MDAPPRWARVRILVGVGALVLAVLFSVAGVVTLARRSAPPSAVVATPPSGAETTETVQSGSGTSRVSGTSLPPPGPGAVTFHETGGRLPTGGTDGVAIRRDPLSTFEVAARWDGADVRLCWGPDPSNGSRFDADGCRPVTNGTPLTVLPSDRNNRAYYLQLRSEGGVRDLDLRVTYLPSASAVPPAADVRVDASVVDQAPAARRFDLGRLSELAVGRVEAEVVWPGPSAMSLAVQRDGSDRGTVDGTSPLRVESTAKADAALWSVTLQSVGGPTPAASVSLRFPLGSAS